MYLFYSFPLIPQDLSQSFIHFPCTKHFVPSFLETFFLKPPSYLLDRVVSLGLSFIAFLCEILFSGSHDFLLRLLLCFGEAHPPVAS